MIRYGQRRTIRPTRPRSSAGRQRERRPGDGEGARTVRTGPGVVEKGGGTPDKTPVEQSEALAAESYAAVRSVFPDAGDHTAYARDVAGAIFDAAEEVNASAIAYRSRGGNRLMQFLSGDISLKLVTNADRPVIALPRENGEE